MLIRFTIENFLSFRDRTTFSMLPGKGSLKPSHKTRSIKGISVLKSGLIFGANASGKSNMIKAIAFGKRLIMSGTKSDQLIPIKPFRLNTKSIISNSRFEYELQHKGKNYAYGFVLNEKEIVEEWLYEINNKTESKIFERNNSSKNVFDIQPLLKKNKKEEDKQFLHFIAKGTPNNQLLLTEIRSRKVKDNVQDISDLLNVIDWFQNSLNIIFPDDKYNAGIKLELKDNSKLQESFEQLLAYFDTGINGVDLVEVDVEKVPVPKEILEHLQTEIFTTSSETNTVMLSPGNDETYFFKQDKGNLKAHKFQTKHKIEGSEGFDLFDTTDESDGTNRIIDFIPLILDLLNGGNVFLIDEMERSLHPNLMYDLIDLFLDKAEKIDSQLIVASHESSLLTQKLLRKDEIWFVEKDDKGASKLFSLEEYNVRFDKEIRKDYLLGRYRAVPKIGNRNSLSVLVN